MELAQNASDRLRRRMKGVRKFFPLSAPAQAVLIFALAFASRAAWVLTLKDDFYWRDEHSFVEVARQLVKGEGYVAESYRSNPIHPVYLSLVFRWFGENFLLARLGQCLFGALTCVLIARIGALLVGPPAGFMSGLILAVYLPHIYLAGVFYAEGLLIFWTALAVWIALSSVMPRPNLLRACLTGVVFAVAALTRPVVLPLIPCVCIAWIYQAPADWRNRLSLCAVLALASVATIFPWTLRNYAAYHTWIPISTGGGTLLWLANNPASTATRDDWYLGPDSLLQPEFLRRLPASDAQRIESEYREVKKHLEEAKQLGQDAFLAGDKILAPLAVRYIIAHPMTTLKRCAKRLSLMFLSFSPTETDNEHTRPFFRVAASVSFYPMFLLAVAGLLVGLPRHRELMLLYLILVVQLTFSSLMPGTQTRYRLPLDPYLIIFASLALSRWADRFLPTRETQ